MTRNMWMMAPAALMALAAAASAQLSLFHADQTGAQEVPPVVTNGTGTFDILVTGAPGSYKLTFVGAYSGLTGNYTVSHLHQAPAGSNGGVVLDIGPFHTPSGTTAGSWKGTNVPVSDALVTALAAGNIYVNTHSSFKTGGELRGQLGAVATQPFVASQDGLQEVPPVITTGTGDFNLLLSGSAGSFKVAFTGSYMNLIGNYTVSHLHQAPAGSGGPVVLDIGPFHIPGGGMAGSWAGVNVSVSDTLASNLIAGNIYVNTHSSFKTGGEIRGQLGAPPVPCFADCDGSGALSIDDFICFQTNYALGDPTADCDGSGNLNIDDFICFQTLFALGC
jgi:CHRD domain